jgi:hypothetical protein
MYVFFGRSAYLAPRTFSCTPRHDTQRLQMADLDSMSVGALRERAVSVGVPAEQIEAARDGCAPKVDLIALISAAQLAAKTKAERQPEPEQSIKHLSTMNVRALRQQAASAGVSAQQIEDARDSDDPKGALISLITGQVQQVQLATAPTPIVAAEVLMPPASAAAPTAVQAPAPAPAPSTDVMAMMQMQMMMQQQQQQQQATQHAQSMERQAAQERADRQAGLERAQGTTAQAMQSQHGSTAQGIAAGGGGGGSMILVNHGVRHKYCGLTSHFIALFWPLFWPLPLIAA